MPPRTAIQARRSLGANPIPSSQTGQSGGPAGMTFTESVSNPSIGVTQEEADQNTIITGDQGDDNKGGESTVIPKKDDPPKKKFTIQDTFNFFSKFSPLAAGGKLFGSAIDAFIKSPKAKQFTNPNDLAIIRSLFTDKKGEVDVDKLNDYYDNYKITIGEGLTSDKASGEAAKFFEEQGIVDNEKAYEDFKNAIMGAKAPQGSEAQRRLDPESFYD